MIGEFEQLVLLAVLRCEDSANGVAVKREIEQRAGRRVARGAVYTTLERLEAKGMLRSALVESSPSAGTPRRFYHVETAGIDALRDAAATVRYMWSGLESILGDR